MKPARTYPTVYMPSTGRPAPPVLTVEMVAELLMVDEGTKDAARTVTRYRRKYPHVLRGLQIGNHVRYTLLDTLDLIETIQQDNPR